MQLEELKKEITRLQAEVERLNDVIRLKDQDHLEASRVVTHVSKQRNKQQSELTKARELFVRLLPLHGYSSELIVAVNDFMQSNQSAPADNGDRIAMEATIAQQGQRIADLEADKGHGEPVAFIQIPKNVEKYGHADQADRLCFGKPGQFFVDGKSPMFDFISLYTAPPAPVSAPEKYDDVLMPFLALMRAELHANAHKGDRPGWLQMDRKTAILEVFYHMGKLHQAVHRGEEAAIKEYAADVANMCMMLLDVCACLDATAALNKSP